MNERLRDIVSRFLVLNAEDTLPWDELTPFMQRWWCDKADALIAVLEDAGCRIGGPDDLMLERERFERIAEGARALDEWLADVREIDVGWLDDTRLREWVAKVQRVEWRLHEGDLDALTAEDMGDA